MDRPIKPDYLNPSLTDNPVPGNEVPIEQRALGALNSAATGFFTPKAALDAYALVPKIASGAADMVASAPRILGNERGAVRIANAAPIDLGTVPHPRGGFAKVQVNKPILDNYLKSITDFNGADKSTIDALDTERGFRHDKALHDALSRIPDTSPELTDAVRSHIGKFAEDVLGMASGGIVNEVKTMDEQEKESPIILKLRELMMGTSHPVMDEQANAKTAANVDAPPTPPQPMAEGGKVELKHPAPYTGIAKESPDLSPVAKALNDAAKQPTKISMANPNPIDPNNPAKGVFVTHRFADGGVVASDDEKRSKVLEHLKQNPPNLNDGGAIPSADGSVDPSQLPGQESKLQTIMRALGVAGTNLINSPAGKIADFASNPVGAAADMIAPKAAAVLPGVANAALKATGAVTGQTVPQVPDQAAPSSAPQAPPVSASPAPAVPLPTPHSTSPHGTSSGPNPLDQLGKFDPNAATPGLNVPDRQALAGQLDQNQHTFGNYLAEAVAGLGDAIAAKGGVQQNALGNIFALQTQQRHEALENFDKARQVAVDHFNMKNSADQALIANLKARGELQLAPGIAASLGHPELAGKPVQQAELVLKTDAMKYDFANKMQERKVASLKDAADEVDKALAHGGMFGTQKSMDAATRLRLIHAQAIKNDPEAFGYKITGGK